MQFRAGRCPLSCLQGPEGPQCRLSPLELRRLLLSGEAMTLWSGDGSGCDPEAAREAFPLRISMTCGKMRVT